MTCCWTGRYLFMAAVLFLLSACSGGAPEKPRPASIVQPELLLQRGITYYNDNNFRDADTRFVEALGYYRSIDNPDGITRSCLNLAKTSMAVNDTARAAAYLDRARHVAKANDLDVYDDHIAILGSSLSIRQGELVQAATLLTHALTSPDATTRLAALKNRTVVAFLNDDDDRQRWLERYREENSSSGNRPSHRARILRFDAELAGSSERMDSLLKQALELARGIPDKPAIAATLTQWGDTDSGHMHPDVTSPDEDAFARAEDRYLRALYIRHKLGDRFSTVNLLEKLESLYARHSDTQVDSDGAGKLERTRYWQNRIRQDKPVDWPALIDDFDTYPR